MLVSFPEYTPKSVKKTKKENYEINNENWKGSATNTIHRRNMIYWASISQAADLDPSTFIVLLANTRSLTRIRNLRRSFFFIHLRSLTENYTTTDFQTQQK